MSVSGLNGPAASQNPVVKEPPVVDPGSVGAAPSDAVLLFDGKDLSHFRGETGTDLTWKLEKGFLEVVPKTGGLVSKEEFGDCQLHIEWAEPAEAKGQGQARGNSGVYLMGRYEIQVLDCYNNKTSPQRQCGAFYGRSAPLVNACRKPGEWQTYDIVFHAPGRLADGSVVPGFLTVIQNGVLVQDHIAVAVEPTRGARFQGFAEAGPLYLQDHGNPVRFRNIWVRRLGPTPNP